MVKARKLFLEAFILILFVNLISAVPVIEINVSSHFIEGDMIKFSYTILSQQNENIKYVASINCPGSPEALLNLKEANLIKNEPLLGEYSYGVMDENVKSGNCVASISVLEPYTFEFKKNFEVSGVSDLSITSLICKDASCSEKTKIFILGEKIYLNYASSTENVLINGTLTYPDKSSEEISLPYLFSAKQIGTYELNLVASKEGYKTTSLDEQFGVIEDNANIKYANLGNGTVGENKKGLIGKIILYLIYFLIGVFILLIILKLIKRIKNKEN
jgi:hypothetical protein